MGYGWHPEDTTQTRSGTVTGVLSGVLVLNLAVAAAKLAYGSFSGSVAMVADGFHSLFDGASNIVGLIGTVLAHRPADASHPYGHGKYETWASIVIGVMLAAAGWNVGRAAVMHLMDGGAGMRVDAGSFVVMGGTLVVNLLVSTFERRAGRRLGSEVLLADASHTASDVLVSIGVIAGLMAVRAGYPLADPVIALIVALMILRAAWSVFRRSADTFSDRARLPVADVREMARSVPGVIGCHDVRTRGSLSEVYVDLHVQVDPGETLQEAHRIAESVERAVCRGFEHVTDVIVHVEPMDDYQAKKTAGQMGGRG